MTFELLDNPGKPRHDLPSIRAGDRHLQRSRQSRDEIRTARETAPITLTPSPELIALVKKSQEAGRRRR